MLDVDAIVLKTNEVEIVVTYGSSKTVIVKSYIYYYDYNKLTCYIENKYVLLLVYI